MYLMLRGDWQGHLKRSIKDPKGKVLRSYEFVPKAPLELVEASDLIALESDCVSRRPKLLPVEFDDQHHVQVLEQQVIIDTIEELKKSKPKADPKMAPPK